jgi:hypothetical protein
MRCTRRMRRRVPILGGGHRCPSHLDYSRVSLERRVVERRPPVHVHCVHIRSHVHEGLDDFGTAVGGRDHHGSHTLVRRRISVGTPVVVSEKASRGSACERLGPTGGSCDARLVRVPTTWTDLWRRMVRTRMKPMKLARCSAVEPLLSRPCTSAPISSSNSQSFGLPWRAALVHGKA